MESIILKVVLVLGIIIAGGFLLFFMADILMAIFNGKKDEKIIDKNEKQEVAKVENQLKEAGASQEEAKALLNGAVVESYNPNEEEAPAEVEETQTEEVEETAEEEAEEETEETEDDRDAYIEARRKALMERLSRMNEEEDEEEETEEEESEEEVEETESEEEEAEESDEEESSEEVVDLDEETDEEVEEEDDIPSEELEEARRALEEERAKAAALRAELEEARRAAATTPVQTAEPVYLTEEEYEARLAVLTERLKLNEKELRQCKKEFIPLRRVKKTLESDEKKLRRKEALVAKQKVVLYGVNNYADIDEEKAKKLAEDLDLLDGLKLSVEHCQEVMAKNSERYPLLERIYVVLTEQNEAIKADIARAEKELAEVRAKKGND